MSALAVLRRFQSEQLFDVPGQCAELIPADLLCLLALYLRLDLSNWFADCVLK
jgi:hypothetical protein